ncbi:MAG TPA: hypothetical protein VF693_04465 [Allosphingosinicella sp.]|jgi:hypothetical protein
MQEAGPEATATTIAAYSKARTLAWTLGPFIVLAALYALLSPYPLSYVFSVENWSRSTPWQPNPWISTIAVTVFVGMVLYQAVTIVFLGKKFVWTDGRHLFVGYTRKAALTDLRVDEAWVRAAAVGDRLIIPFAQGSSIAISTGLSRITGEELLRRIKAAADLRNSANSPHC